IDHAKTAMGSRTIKKWLLRPLVSQKAIGQRQELVESILSSVTTLMRFSGLLGQVADLERIVGRLVLQRAIVADFLQLNESLKLLPDIISLLKTIKRASMASFLLGQLHFLPQLVELLTAAVNSDGSGNPIKDGFDLELDRLRLLVKNSQTAILALEREEVKKTGIESLKVRYTDAFGYSIEVTNTHVKKIPERYVHKQTLVGRRRYITEELKELEVEIVQAREKIESVEAAVFERVKAEVLEFAPQLREISQALSVLDAIVSFAKVAYDNNYVRPSFNDSCNIIIEDGRHPVVERSLQFGEFVPNDTKLTDKESLWIITGPNMGGKSTYLRQVALILLMAQTGCFVPAKKAQLPISDRIFTRIGSGDNLAAGKSTFLVEMEEAAAICQQATEKSLVILDEVGRGTSTFDGMAIAQAIIEYLFSTVKARCLFATHYHELTHLQDKFLGIVNYYTKCKRNSSGMVFVHKLAQGAAEGSFGIEVAQLANLPDKVVARARELLISMESGEKTFSPACAVDSHVSGELKKLLDENERLKATLNAFNAIDPDDLTPRQAHEFICRLRERNV
ncbi:DNA mismatch repair protein MutS, partial [Candidatus Babeliales bacterium]|nr:DNA mismatch repair protein MutS [Candidatus Babeliales bacterium]